MLHVFLSAQIWILWSERHSFFTGVFVTVNLLCSENDAYILTTNQGNSLTSYMNFQRTERWTEHLLQKGIYLAQQHNVGMLESIPKLNTSFSLFNGLLTMHKLLEFISVFQYLKICCGKFLVSSSERLEISAISNVFPCSAISPHTFYDYRKCFCSSGQLELFDSFKISCFPVTHMLPLYHLL